MSNKSLNYTKFLVISKQAILAALTTFIDELLPIIGMCIVISDSDNNASLTPEFSEPKIRQIGLFCFNNVLNSGEPISMLAELISSERMVEPDCFNEVTNVSALACDS